MNAPRPESTIPFVDLGAQTRAIRADIDMAIARVLDRGDFILGGAVGEFEQAFAAFVGAKHTIGISNGLDALRLTLQALDVGAGHEVILPANTFIATALAVSAAGARPVLVDCEPESFNIDPARIEAAITRHTRAIMPVHLCGQSADLDPILEIAKKHGLIVIEDAAQAQGTLYKGRGCGSIGVAGCFSFYPSKNLGAFGDAGAVTTNDDELAARLKLLRHYGQRVKYEHAVQGVNARLDTLQAAILGVKLPHLNDWNAARTAHADAYRAALDGVGDLVLPRAQNYSTHIYHLFMVQTARRDALQAHLTDAGIQTVIHYPIPIHLQAAYRDLGYREGDFPVAERLAKRILSLPMYPELEPGQIARVCDAMRAFFRSA